MASCLSLPEIEAGICGNRVKEDGEECDGYPQGTLADAGDAEAEAGDAGADAEPQEHCGRQCRYVCREDGTDFKCPADEGYSCGVDGVCRRSSGLSASEIVLSNAGARRLASGDFDGDGRVEAVLFTETAVDIQYFSTGGSVEKTVSVPNEGRFPGLGDLDGDGRTDLALNLGRSVGVLLGQENRTLVPRNYPTMAAPNATSTLVPFGFGAEDWTLLAFVGGDTTTQIEALVLPDANGGPRTIPVEKTPPEPLLGTLQGAIGVTKKVFPNTDGCPTVVFELAEVDSAGIPASIGIIHCEDVNGPKVVLDTLPLGGKAWGGVFVADIDQDGNEDFIYGSRSSIGSSDGTLYVKRGSPFAENDPVPLTTESLETCQTSTRLRGNPLAMGDLDGDGYPDIVDKDGVWFYRKAPAQPFRKCMAESSEWQQALIGDFDGNGFPDLLAMRGKQPLLDFWSGAGGGTFHTSKISIDAPIGRLVGGDFNGDTLYDAVLSTAAPENKNPEGSPPAIIEHIALFGRPFAPPDVQTPLGAFRGAQNLVAGFVTGRNALGEMDALSDLVVLSAPVESAGSPLVSVLPGRAGSALLSPLFVRQSLAALPGAGPETTAVDPPNQILVARFATEICREPNTKPEDASATDETRSTLVTLGADRIWVAGCGDEGTSNIVAESLSLTEEGGALIAPSAHDASHEYVALFAAGRDEKGNVIDAKVAIEDDKLADAPGMSTAPSYETLAPSLLLPTGTSPERPSLLVDVDGDGLRDLVLTTQSMEVVVFWNDLPSEGVRGGITSDNYTSFSLPPEIFKDSKPERLDIADMAFANLDHDPMKELIVMSPSGVYRFDLDSPRGTASAHIAVATQFDTPISTLRDGQALLVLDANSDGVDDLVIADNKRVVLYLGQELAP